ncbi:MAG: acetyl-coenzyme A carboxylase carboxyl transferase subunit beta [Gammaproteobacteria bacterium]|jgi:acetyl-CoA carboxylase carboxyl transferase subunit beta|nr:MAG: acetyl-coenzyme A carboxylase carboxyl transferase subunit beta [Gammaproteobacteria bacterium]GIT60365.1 MAG: acetyl-coenzyme A carboxylase carboxyl transferase subunit beta [Gammaproteobacteria bacterium]|tara:strand:- start:344 stop:1207 length:864 start_codon:yes stop_codon:yes gene_type:complete
MANWFDKILPSFIKKGSTKKSSVPEGLWQTCSGCNNVLYVPELEASLYVCPKCDHHVRIGARKRLDLFLDSENQIEIASNVSPTDWLKFKDTKRYRDRITEAESNSDENEAIVVKQGTLLKLPLVAAAFEFRFMGGSMGSVVGQKFVEGVNQALNNQLPFVCFSTSGGARMQESLVSLYQMAKTSAVLQKLKEAGQPYISIMIDPIYGGVAASLAMLGDINIAEPKALVGFTGPRVIEQTLKVQLPEGFQRSEFLLDHGAIDMIVHRKDLQSTVHRLLLNLLDKPSS